RSRPLPSCGSFGAGCERIPRGTWGQRPPPCTSRSCEWCLRQTWFLLARTHLRTPGLRNEAPRDVLVTLRMIVCVEPQRRLLTSQERCDPVVTGCRVVTVA